ncbi:MAG TPA: endolytic transglycosylase MltG [Actinomycetota bacterium]
MEPPATTTTPSTTRAERLDRRPPSRRRASLIVALVLFVVAGAVVLWGSSYYAGCKRPPDATGETVSFEVPEGATGQDVVASLFRAGLIRCEGFVGNLLLRGTGRASEIRAGAYELTVGMSLEEIVGMITAKPERVPTVRLTIPEGLRIRSTFPGERSIASVVEEQLGIPAKRFAALAESGDYELPPYLPASADTAEGFLFPETYQLVKQGLDAEAVIDRLLEQFATEAEALPWENAKELGLSPYEIVVLASMIERETAVAKERPLVAGVIYNRLREGMTLGIDATLLYDDPTPDGQLTTADLETDTPYNTRINGGLPPTPIASPGRGSLQAALEPRETEYFYYVLCPPDGASVHRFAATYDEHLANVRECLG